VVKWLIITDDSKAVQGAKKMSLEPTSSNTLLADKTRNCSIHIIWGMGIVKILKLKEISTNPMHKILIFEQQMLLKQE